MNEVNQKIVNAIIEKAERVCPDSLALIGVYGLLPQEMSMRNLIWIYLY